MILVGVAPQKAYLPNLVILEFVYGYYVFLSNNLSALNQTYLEPPSLTSRQGRHIQGKHLGI